MRVLKGIGLLALSASLLIVSCGQAQNANQPSQTDTLAPLPSTIPALTGPELERYSLVTGHFFDSMLAGRFNGSVLVAKNGVVLYERYKGFENPRMRKDSLTAHTAFHLASMSKTFTAMGTLKLWQEGKLDIHDPVSKYLAGFPYPAVTVETLLNHRSGLHNYVHFMYKPDVDKRKLLNNQDVLNYIIKHARDRDIYSGVSNRHFEYSNTNYALLALIIEKVSGLPYPEFMTKTFFEPLRMQDTYVYTISDSAKAMASFYQSGRPFRMEFLDLVYGDKNIYSTVRDIYKWDQALRNGELFSKGVLDSAYAGYSFEKPGQRNYGLGWRMLFIPNGKKLIYHNGWWHGNRTVLIRMLDENATIIALSNNDYRNVYAAKRLCDLFGDYRQGHESFDEGEMDSTDPGPGGEPREGAGVSASVAPAAAVAVAHPVVHHHARRRRRVMAKKKIT
ncbi:MAG TPA: serine hydrolase domain-containing protein [Puia sp.]|nr:serine hydrolase domain-containing protein [Puia sp.]